ncbi:hypothetical protein BJX65DRAFT_302662 [Aspergillus insuetus]
MSTDQTPILSCVQATQDPNLDWTAEAAVDMTSIRDDFCAFFGRTEEEWNTLNESTWTGPSSFPTYEEWVAHDGSHTGQRVAHTDDVQMTDDDAVGITVPATCDPGQIAESASTGYIDPSVILSTQHTMGGSAFPGNAAPLVEANPTTGIDNNIAFMQTPEKERKAMKTIVQTHANSCTECKARIPEPPSALRGIIRDLEHMYQETWKELRLERHRSSRFRRLLDELRAKRLEALQQHEVSEALKEFEGRYQEVRDELKIERNKSFTYKKMAFTEKATYSGFLARVAELEEMNAKLQGKYEAAMAIVDRLQ